MWYSNSKKFKKYHDINYKVKAPNKLNTKTNIWGLLTLHNVSINEYVLTSIIRICKRSLTKNSKILLSQYPDRFFSAKPQEIRMGKGKGTPIVRIVNLKKGEIFIKLISIDSDLVLERCLYQCVRRLPVAVKILRPFMYKW